MTSPPSPPEPSRDSRGEDLDFTKHILSPNVEELAPKELDRLFPPIDVVRLKWWVGPRLLLLVFVLLYPVPSGVDRLLGETMATIVGIPSILFGLYITPRAVRSTMLGLADLGFFWSVYGWHATHHEPWLIDHAWGDLGETRSAIGRVWALHRKVTIGGILLGAGVLYIFGQLAWIPVALALTFVFVRGFLLATSGASRVTYLERPYRLGEPVTVRFGLAEGATIFWKARYLLACYEERGHPAGSRSPFGFSRRQLYREMAAVPPDHVPEAGSDVDIPFSRPESVRSTRLRQRYRIYWEFRVIAETESGPFEERFMVPVY